MRSSQRRSLDPHRLSVFIDESEKRITPPRLKIEKKEKEHDRNSVGNTVEAVATEVVGAAELYDRLASPSREEKNYEPEHNYLSEDEVTVVREDRVSRNSNQGVVSKKNNLLYESDTQVSLSTVPSGAQHTLHSMQSLHSSEDAINGKYNASAAPKLKMSKSELKESRRKAAVRLAEKRREYQLTSLQEIEAKRQECTLHRVKWRANAKGKRTEELDRQVDKFILRDVILNNPKALAFADQHDFDCVTGRFDESVWGDLLIGLDLPGSDIEWEVDGEAQFPRISEHILSSVGLASATKLIQRSKFDGDEDNVVRLSVARSFAQKTLPTTVPSRTSSFKEENPRRSITSTENTGPTLDQLIGTPAESMLATQKQRSQSMQPYRLKEERRSRSPTGLEPKKRLSLFSKFVPEKRRSSFDDKDLRGFTSPVGGAGSSSWDENNSCSSDGTHTVRLADSVFLVGPGEDDIEALIQQYLSENPETYQGGSSKSNKSANLRSSEKSSGTSGFPSPYASAEQSVEPKLLYLSNKDPEVEEEVLPFFCYPRYAEMFLWVIYHYFLFLFLFVLVILIGRNRF